MLVLAWAVRLLLLASCWVRFGLLLGSCLEFRDLGPAALSKGFAENGGERDGHRAADQRHDYEVPRRRLVREPGGPAWEGRVHV